MAQGVRTERALIPLPSEVRAKCERLGEGDLAQGVRTERALIPLPSEVRAAWERLGEGGPGFVLYAIDQALVTHRWMGEH